MPLLSPILGTALKILLRLLKALGSLIFRLTSASYTGSLKYYTLEPIKEIERRCGENADQQKLRQALLDFRCRKKEEFLFVRSAAGLSAAAVIAGFTWPILERAHWATTMLWHWSLTSSIFSIISSAQDRLLREFPSDTPEDGVERAEKKEDLDSVLPLVLGYMMCWVWQTPIMLMSYAWVLFLVGYLIVVLVPFYDGRNVSQSRLSAGITAAFCCLIFLNFVLCSHIVKRRVRKLNQKR